MIWLLLMIILPNGSNQQSIYPCGNSRVKVTYHSEKQYNLDIALPSGTTDMILGFNTKVSLIVSRPYSTGIFLDPEELGLEKSTFHVKIYPKKNPRFNVEVLCTAGTGLAYISSILADDQELCRTPLIGYFDESIIFGEEPIENSPRQSLEKSCGRRKVEHTELILHGQPTQYGDWPWHVAISRVERSSLNYICGGTLLSKTSVVTAAHCASISGNAVTPSSLTVAVGKHNLIGEDIEQQERRVFEVIIHPEFNAVTLNNDIALLNLKSEAVFTDYVQPACLWHRDIKLPTEDTFGTVVGWGFNHQDVLSPTLQQITIPIVSELHCLKSNPIFFHKNLNNNKFCAGFANGTSACNGDSGGGLMVFVPDTPGDASQLSGSWYVRGIVSLSPRRSDASICDPDQYTIFTDVGKYLDWMSEYLD